MFTAQNERQPKDNPYCMISGHLKMQMKVRNNLLE